MKEQLRLITDFLDSKDVKFLSAPSEIDSKFITFTRLTPNDYGAVKEFFTIFSQEFTRYSNTFLKEAKIEAVGFVKNLKVDSTGSNDFISLFATTDPKTNSVLFDVSYIQQPNYCRRTIHHELFHLIELNLNGNYKFQDPEWLQANKDFKYFGTGSDAHYNKNYKEKSHPHLGFVSRYSMYSIDEDRAEVFTYMMDKRLQPVLKRWCVTDLILAKKVRILNRMLTKAGFELDQLH